MQNTVFDEEYVPLNVPAARPGASWRIPPLVRAFFAIYLQGSNGLQVPDTEEHVRIRRDLARALEFERRVHRLQTVIEVSHDMLYSISSYLTLESVGIHPRC